VIFIPIPPPAFGENSIPAMKIIAMSGGGRGDAKDYLIVAQKLGAAKTLAKPFSGKELVEAVASVLSA
jgi:DNA-binding response OmpR family regulator